MKKLTLTRALNEVKITEKKISQMNDGKVKGWVALTKNGKIVSGQFDDLDKFNATVKANKDRVSGLVAYRNKVKSALIKANNETVVTIAKESLTIAEAIDRKAFADSEIYMYRKISNSITQVQNQFDAANLQVDQKVDQLVNTALEGDGKKDPTVVKGIEDSVRNNNKYVLEDNNKVKDWVEAEIEKLEEFLNEVDFTLSEANAKTEIELED
jgi:hypothetical protein